MITVQRYSQCDPQEFTNNLVSGLTKVFNCDRQHLPENYNDYCEWGLLTLLGGGKLVDYSLLFVDGVIWAGAGGIIRSFGGDQIYQGAFRGFSCAKFSHDGLGMRSLLHRWITGPQIGDASSLGCQSFVISFNQHNKRLFDLTHKYIMPRALPSVNWEVSPEPVMFNNVPQWLLTHKIQNVYDNQIKVSSTTL